MAKRKRKSDDSLLGADAQQGMLLHVEPHPAEQEARSAKQCTGEYLFTHYRQDYDGVVKALAANAGVRWITRTYQIGNHTVAAIARREKLEVATLKAGLADALLLGAQMFAERAMELAESCDSAYEAAGAAEKLATTSQLMRGQATAINAGVVFHVDANAMGAEMMRQAREMGLGAGENLALGNSGGAGDLGAISGPMAGELGLGEAVPMVTGDKESIVIEAQIVDPQKDSDSRSTVSGESGEPGVNLEAGAGDAGGLENGGGGGVGAADPSPL